MASAKTNSSNASAVYVEVCGDSLPEKPVCCVPNEKINLFSKKRLASEESIVGLMDRSTVGGKRQYQL